MSDVGDQRHPPPGDDQGGGGGNDDTGQGDGPGRNIDGGGAKKHQHRRGKRKRGSPTLAQQVQVLQDGQGDGQALQHEQQLLVDGRVNGVRLFSLVSDLSLLTHLLPPAVDVATVSLHQFLRWLDTLTDEGTGALPAPVAIGAPAPDEVAVSVPAPDEVAVGVIGQGVEAASTLTHRQRFIQAAADLVDSGVAIIQESSEAAAQQVALAWADAQAWRHAHSRW